MRTTMRKLIRLIFALLVSVAMAQPVWAGGWSLDRLEIEVNSPGEFHGDKLTYKYGPNGGYTEAEEEFIAIDAEPWLEEKGPVYPHKFTYRSRNGEVGVETRAALDYRGSRDRNHESPDNQLSAGSAKSELTVTPVFKWNSSGENDEPTSEFWMWERSFIEVIYQHGIHPMPEKGQTSYTEENPYDGQNFSLAEFDLGLGSGGPSPTRDHPYQEYGHIYARDSGTQTKPNLVKASGNEARGETRTLRATASSGGWNAADLGGVYYRSSSGARATVKVSYQAGMTEFALNVGTSEFSRTGTPRQQDINAYADRSENGTDVLGDTIYNWSGGANYSVQLSPSLLSSISTPGSENPVTYHWNTSGTWADGAQSNSENSISSVYSFGTGPTLTFAPHVTEANVIVEGDNVESGLLTANATINWYEPPSTEFRVEFEVVGIDLESGEETIMSGGEGNGDPDQILIDTINQNNEDIRNGIEDGAEIAMAGAEIAGSFVTPDVFDLIPGAGGVLKKLFKSSQAGIKLGKTINKMRSRLGNKTDALKAAARRRLGKAADHPVAIRIKTRVFPSKRVGKLPPNSSRAPMPKAQKERVKKTKDFHGTLCFVSGTLIDTAEGFRVIESLKTGDLVWAKDEFTNEVALKPITQTIERLAPSTLALTFSNGETIETTIEHPFYVQDRGFTPAGLVAIGNSIVTRAGPSLEVTRVEKHSSAQKVYNLSVEEFNTYFVGKSALWVHNVDGCGVFTSLPDGGKFVLKVSDECNISARVINGELSFTVRSFGREQPFSGQDLFGEAMDTFYRKGVDVTSIRGQWTKDYDALRDNIDAFNKLIHPSNPNRVSEAVAASQVWTGRQAKDYGYTNVSILSRQGTPGDYWSVEVLFTKP